MIKKTIWLCWDQKKLVKISQKNTYSMLRPQENNLCLKKEKKKKSLSRPEIKTLTNFYVEILRRKCQSDKKMELWLRKQFYAEIISHVHNKTTEEQW